MYASESLSVAKQKEKPGKLQSLIRPSGFSISYGMYWMAIIAPILVGTQIAAAASVAAGVKPFKAGLLITLGTLI
jgi:hypothetical protein